ncbi:hypothetical protein [Spartinivicinus poritis]|uniref:Uncharacterized protein n=1 Tax=Spartinivicinus poritis TaxID=2994640 RepID=A0ABT5U8C7_9GAMM|nr:hypothetical protein [Spartinivicinus sp. A2-2]MDE1461698.1 hypothetical protein [Spartinivicinus sp. A2-2]
MKARWKCLISLLVILMCVGSWFTWVDEEASELTDQQLKQAAVTFATARLLNGVISVIQGTEVSIQPVGVGVTITAGEILDPVNDLVERFSWVMLTSTTSLGIQKLINELIATGLMSILLAVSAVFYLFALWFIKDIGLKWWLVSAKLFACLFVLRYAVVLMVLFNQALYLGFFAAEQQAATDRLQDTTEQIEAYHQAQQQALQAQPESFWEKLKNNMDQLTAQLNPVEKMKQLKAISEQALEDIIKLIASFILQTILLPLLFLWMIVKMLKLISSYSPVKASPVP